MSENKPSKDTIDESGLDKVSGGAGGAGVTDPFGVMAVVETARAIDGLASGKGYTPPGETKVIGANPALQKKK